jgi:hypothetical protein
MPWLPWALLIGGAVVIANLACYGTMNVYWAGLVGPRFTGVLSGITACLQVVAGQVLVNLSGSWFRKGVEGHAQLDVVMAVGGVIMLVALAPVLLSREVTVRSAPQGLVAPH